MFLKERKKGPGICYVLLFKFTKTVNSESHNCCFKKWDNYMCFTENSIVILSCISISQNLMGKCISWRSCRKVQSLVQVWVAPKFLHFFFSYHLSFIFIFKHIYWGTTNILKWMFNMYSLTLGWFSVGFFFLLLMFFTIDIYFPLNEMDGLQLYS